MHHTPLTNIGSRSYRDPAVQLAVLHRITKQLAERSTSSAVEVDVTAELHDVFDARYVAIYRSQPDGTLLRSALAGDSSDAPSERIDGESSNLHSSPSIPEGSLALAGLREVFGGQTLLAPISHHGEKVGIVVVNATATTDPLDSHDAKFLDLVVRIVAPHLFYLDSREGDRSAALTDSITGLGNRRAFEERLGEELARSNRSGQQVALLVCAIDASGRQAPDPGDDALRTVVDALKQSVRLSDPAFRTGERQLSALLTRSGVEGALVVAKRLMAAVDGLTGVAGQLLTLSIGVAALKAGVKHTPLDLAAVALTRKAEDALHSAMASGGKRTVSAESLR
ncbi:MAG: GGDEF domain-containing protein [Anaerolineae bacterium]|nr:GGDEF domain-containing protein [Gemmatimonadaceae bacterium]